MKKTICLSVFLCWILCCNAQVNTLDLSGTWRFQMDPMDFGKTPGSQLFYAKLSESINLPGTMDEAGKGIKTTARYVDRLTRKFEYCGPAWYQREVVIPENWRDKLVVLKLERCHWETSVYVDGTGMGVEERLSTPNRYDLTARLTPGVHTLTICVDNRLKYPMDQWNHGTTEYTQTNWNGIVGDIELEAHDKAYLCAVKAYPDVAKKSVMLDMTIDNRLAEAQNAALEISICDNEGKVVVNKTLDVLLEKGLNQWSRSFALGNHAKVWDEFTPNLYHVKTNLRTKQTLDNKSITFGLRNVQQGAHHIKVNGRNIHLRGTLDCCIFPKTGYPPTHTQEWKRIFTIVKEYGLNHVRFHSWCPPEAAFDAADEIGVYLQAELPMWIKDVGKYPARRDFFEKEMMAILNEYGNHPSFILMCNGNENEGDFSILEDLIQKGQKFDNRRLYSASTARTHTASDQFYVSHVSPKGGITVYEGIPSTDWDKNKTSDIDCPVIAHETGQRCMYPNFKEMSKYTGVLTPRNFEVFRERLARNGMLHQADDFLRATGAHTVLQYKEVNESLLRTSKSGGFQLLGLTDFPGQGSAFVGILDAFWDSKGLVTPEKYRESCAPTVLLARMPKRAYSASESLPVEFDIYHFGPSPIQKGKLNWALVDQSGRAIASGNMRTPAVACANVDSLGTVSIPLLTVTEASQLTLHATMDGYHNEWNVWVYPSVEQINAVGYVLANDWKEAKSALEKGEKVLFIPEQAQGRKTHFASHFWNPIMFNWYPTIVGTLIDNDHPAFKAFPTSYYADWQWWDILNQSVAVDLTAIRNITPLIQSVDTYEHNRKLGIAFEANVGKGKLLVACVDVLKNIDKRLATKQLIHSFKRYVASDDFEPKNLVPVYLLDAVFESTAKTGTATNSSAIEQLLNK